jgi:hypothetical protein
MPWGHRQVIESLCLDRAGPFLWHVRNMPTIFGHPLNRSFREVITADGDRLDLYLGAVTAWGLRFGGAKRTLSVRDERTVNEFSASDTRKPIVHEQVVLLSGLSTLGASLRGP